ncbi:MAG: nucleotidyltransferase family protein [Chloroflexota bacterium]
MEIFFALCARAVGHDAYYERLIQYAASFNQWDQLVIEAENHGMGPLIYSHLHASTIAYPAEIKRQLKGLYLRHRYANATRAKVLTEVIEAYQHAGIEMLVLKGAALAHHVYPQPGLRPMRDIDILVKKSQARQAQTVLADLGFNAPLPPEHDLPDKHLISASRTSQGLMTSIEVHHNLYSDLARFPSTALETVIDAATPFQIDGVTAYTLGHEDMLRHVYLHAFGRPQIFQSLRFMWVADFVSLVERYIDDIDWDKIERLDPRLYNILPLFHFLSPWSPAVLEKIPMDLTYIPSGAGQTFRGWPRTALSAQRNKGRSQLLKDTFLPPEWWLRLYYGLSNTYPITWYRWVGHPLHIMSWVWHYYRQS